MAVTPIVIRGWKRGVFVFREQLDLTADTDVAALALKHIVEYGLLHVPHMIEIEFLDEPNAAERFFRFGTDSRRMVRPLALPGPHTTLH